MKQVQILLATDGGVSIEAHGFKGPDCEQATKYIEQALGKTTERKRKAEFAQRETVNTVQARTG